MLVVFGATGITGAYVLRQALAEGMSARAVARSPDRLPADLARDDRLEVTAADVTDAEAVSRALEGADLVFAALGYKGRPERPTLLPFVQEVVRSMREGGAGRFVYQASALNPEPGRPNALPLRLLRPAAAWALNTAGIWSEHDAVIRFLVEDAADLDWTVTRAGRLSDTESRGELVVRASPGGGVIYRDLAAFSLDALRSGQHARSCPYLGYR